MSLTYSCFSEQDCCSSYTGVWGRRWLYSDRKIEDQCTCELSVLFSGRLNWPFWTYSSYNDAQDLVTLSLSKFFFLCHSCLLAFVVFVLTYPKFLIWSTIVPTFLGRPFASSSWCGMTLHYFLLMFPLVYCSWFWQAPCAVNASSWGRCNLPACVMSVCGFRFSARVS